VFYKLKLRPI